MAEQDPGDPQAGPRLVTWGVAPENGADPAPDTRSPAVEGPAPSIAQPPTGPGRRRGRGPMIGAALTAAVAAAAWFAMSKSEDHGTGQGGPAASNVAAPPVISKSAKPTPTVTPSPSAKATKKPAHTAAVAAKRTVPTPTVDPAETRALSDLAGLRADAVDQVTLDGSWAAQLSSKYVGVTDRLALAANGTHRFLAADILAEHLALRGDERFSGSQVVLLTGTDFGKKSTVNGKTLWVTLAVGYFYDEQSVQEFCQSAYPDKSGAALANVCMPRTLTPPH